MALGEPPRSDVEAAAKLLVEYRRKNLTGPEFGQMFLMMVDDPLAVTRRAGELEKEEQKAAP